jgi:hypothetical protein
VADHGGGDADVADAPRALGRDEDGDARGQHALRRVAHQDRHGPPAAQLLPDVPPAGFRSPDGTGVEAVPAADEDGDRHRAEQVPDGHGSRSGGEGGGAHRPSLAGPGGVPVLALPEVDAVLDGLVDVDRDHLAVRSAVTRCCLVSTTLRTSRRSVTTSRFSMTSRSSSTGIETVPSGSVSMSPVSSSLGGTRSTSACSTA